MALNDAELTKRAAEGIPSFMKLVSPEPMSGCWLWIGDAHERGYALIYDRSKKKMVRATRLLYETAGISLTPKILVCHKCDNPYCVNPDHLFLGNQSRNLFDCVDKKRHHWASMTACVKGHIYAPGSFTLTPDRGHRVCLACQREHDAKYRKKIREMAFLLGAKGTKHKKMTIGALIVRGITSERIDGRDGDHV